LPEAILSHDIALCLGEILHGDGSYVRNSPAIAFNSNLMLETGKSNASIDLWQGAVDEPMRQKSRSDQQNGEYPVKEPKDSSQVHSRTI